MPNTSFSSIHHTIVHFLPGLALTHSMISAPGVCFSFSPHFFLGNSSLLADKLQNPPSLVRTRPYGQTLQTPPLKVCPPPHHSPPSCIHGFLPSLRLLSLPSVSQSAQTKAWALALEVPGLSPGSVTHYLGKLFNRPEPCLESFPPGAKESNRKGVLSAEHPAGTWESRAGSFSSSTPQPPQGGHPPLSLTTGSPAHHPVYLLP